MQFNARARVHVRARHQAHYAWGRPDSHRRGVLRWDGGTLVVETTDFAPHSAGLGFSLPSSSKKRLIERLTLDSDGTGLTYAFELTDPEMLSAAIRAVTR